MDDPLDVLLRDAIVATGDGSFEALAVAGAKAVKRFHDLLAGERVIELPKGRDRELIDNMMDLSCRLAARFPDDYLAAFNNRRWVASGFVLTGLGYTRRKEAQPLSHRCPPERRAWSYATFRGVSARDHPRTRSRACATPSARRR